MNDPNPIPWKESDLDRLVDGELSREEYGRLLNQLDAAPHGWRQLAHAFLEGQAWRLEFSPPKPVAEVPPPRLKQAFWLKPAPQWLALAAGVMLAFALGTQVDMARDMFSRGGAPDLATVVQPPSLPSDLPRRDVPRQSPQALGNMRVLVNRPTGEPEQTDVPVYDGNEIDPSELWSQSHALPDGLLQQLEKSGRRVVRQRHLVPMHLPDGRQVVMPVERIQLIPRDRTMY
jgi:hypothetical protein